MDSEATYFTNYPSVSVCLQGARVTADDFQAFYMCISLPHSRLVIHCSVWWFNLHPNCSLPNGNRQFLISPSKKPGEICGTHCNHWSLQSQTTRSENMKYLLYQTLLAFLGFQKSDPWQVWLGSHHQTLISSPVPTNAALLSASLSFPCLVWKQEQAPDITQTVNIRHKQLPALLVNGTLWGLGLT